MIIHKGVLTMTYETILCEVNDKVAVVTLNRPQAMNTLNEQMAVDLAECFEALYKENVQILMLQGAEKVFSAGGDIKEMLKGASVGADTEQVMTYLTRAIKALYMLPAVTVAVVHGAAAGFGLSLALACDYVIVEQDAKLAMNFIGIGLIPDGGGHFFMKERVGAVKAKQMIWEGRVMDGEEAVEWDLADIVVENGMAKEVAQQFVAQQLQTPLVAKIETKLLLNGSQENKLDKYLAQEAEMQPRMRATKDHLEGIQAFVEKRQPVFNGE